ncbi:MAG: diguanylate cyclase [Pseudomonadota bacterium]
MSDSWKDKYFASLAESEALEQELKQLVLLLRRAVGRLSLVVPHPDKDLASVLDRLNRQVKRDLDQPALEQLLEQLAVVLSRLDREQKAGQLRHQSPWQVLEAVLKACPPPAGREKARRQALKSLRRTDAAEHLTPLFQEVVSLLSPTPAGAGKEAEKPQIPTPAAAAESRPQTVTDPQPVASTTNAVVSDLGRLLLTLMDRLALAGPEASALRGDLGTDLAVADWPAVLERLAVQVEREIQRRAGERDEMVQFLAQLTGQLDSIGEAVTSTVSGYQAESQHREQLICDVQDNVQSLKRDAGGPVALPDLKQLIETRTEDILTQLRRFQQEAAVREDALRSDAAGLEQQFASLKQESEQLKSRLKEAEAIAYRDGLTGLPNRRAYDERLVDELTQALAGGQPLSLVVCDIDHFKKLNDTLGHHAGDRVLESVAKLMTRAAGEEAFAARYGGEEFAIIIPAAAAATAGRVAERVRETVADAAFSYRGKAIKVTLSCGYTELEPNDSPGTLFQRADACLYRAKSNGRNRVEGAGTAVGGPRLSAAR